MELSKQWRETLVADNIFTFAPVHRVCETQIDAVQNQIRQVIPGCFGFAYQVFIAAL